MTLHILLHLYVNISLYLQFSFDNFPEICRVWVMKANIYKWSGIWFAQTRKDVAQKAILANPNRRFFIVGNKTSPAHFHSGWQLATHVDTVAEFSKRHIVECDQSYLDKQYNSFNYYLEPELGDRPIYYLEVLTPAKKTV